MGVHGLVPLRVPQRGTDIGRQRGLAVAVHHIRRLSDKVHQAFTKREQCTDGHGVSGRSLSPLTP